jgi:hypothetical protein
MKNKLLVLIGLFFCSYVNAEWNLITITDAITDDEKKTAIIKNDLGHTFSIYRLGPGGTVWVNFALSEDVFDQIDPENPPIYRIDKKKPYDLAGLKNIQDMSQKLGLGSQLYLWKPKWVNFQLWHGKEDEGIGEAIVNIMEGEIIVFRYYLSGGGYKDTTFELTGAAEAISEAIGISAQIDHAAQEMLIKFNETVRAEEVKCKKNNVKQKSCSSRVAKCRNHADKNVEQFKSCLK